jgi:hypothetical protein
VTLGGLELPPPEAVQLRPGTEVPRISILLTASWIWLSSETKTAQDVIPLTNDVTKAAPRVVAARPTRSANQ